MRIPDQLTRLDRRVLPPISAALSRLGRGARRLRIVRIVAPVISLAVVLVAVYAAGRPPAPVAGPIGQSVTLGVHQGDSIQDYVAATKADLQDLVATAGSTATTPPKFYALVSLSGYLTPARLTGVFGGLNLQITNTIMRVRSDQQTQIIQLPVNSEDLQVEVERGMQATADKKQQSAADLGVLLKMTGGDSETAQTLRAQYKLEQSVAVLEAATYRAPDDCACVYAAVVYGPLPVLAELAARTGIRAVEARQLTDPSLAVFLPPFPDQYGIAQPPASSTPGP
jgi:hypothetical protein